MRNRPSREMITVSAGEHDCPPRRVDRGDSGGLGVLTHVEVFTEASDDEQGVVDTHSEADHRRHLGAHFGNVDPARSEGHRGHRDPEADQGCADGQTHCHHRTEGDQEDEDGRQNAEHLTGRELQVFEDLAAVFDGETGHDDALAEVSNLVGGGLKFISGNAS